ncbi:type III polyketide synthase BpsA [Bacillus carboniphilus]|uniref:Type III polyketide synthase BpsA n=1 Tax=Bacillus carboniphilus TaxID=86663 RepID=A0ABN0WX23_9BACI
MSKILSVAEAHPPHVINQEQAIHFARGMFQHAYKNIDRLLEAFQNGQIEKRHFVKDLEWYKEKRTFSEKNNEFIHAAVELGSQAITNCLTNPDFLKKDIPYHEIDMIITICTTGLATPSIEARIMNQLPFSPHTKRVPIWGLGCAGGASGLARAHEYCMAYPEAKVLVLTIELCSLTFQPNDLSKSNLIGTSLFADGVACALVVGEQVCLDEFCKMAVLPEIVGVQTTLMEDSLDVMGWEVKNEGLYVVFSKSIPNIVQKWLRPNIDSFLQKYDLDLHKIEHFVAHPGGRKVLEAYEEALSFDQSKTAVSREVLKEFGNMSSATVLYVLNRIMNRDTQRNQWGIGTALGPGFSSELLLLKWVEV